MSFFIFINAAFIICQLVCVFGTSSASLVHDQNAMLVSVLQVTTGIFFLTLTPLGIVRWMARTKPELYPTTSFRALAAATATSFSSVSAACVITEHTSMFLVGISLISLPIIVCGITWLLVDAVDCGWPPRIVAFTLAMHASAMIVMFALAEIGWWHFGPAGRSVGGCMGLVIGPAFCFWLLKAAVRGDQPALPEDAYRPPAASDPTLRLYTADLAGDRPSGTC